MSYNKASLIDLLETSVSPFHTVLSAEKRLKEAGFEKLEQKGQWKLCPGGSYYVSYDSSLFVFVLGQRYGGAKKLRMAAAHGDFPCLVIKKHPDMETAGCKQLNIEVYGGPILNTWLDRPLSAAGQVVLRSNNPWEPKVCYVDIKKPFCIIPNLAIHMNRKINEGVALNRQTDMIPVTGLAGEETDAQGFLEFLANAINTNGCQCQTECCCEDEITAADILDYSLYLYATEKPECVGMKEELLSACHLDDTTSVQAMLDGILACNEAAQMAECFNCASVTMEGIRMIALYDHEEIGSRTKNGACSMRMRSVLGKIVESAGLEGTFWQNAPSVDTLLEDAMLLSVDVAHAMHPNHVGKADPTNRPVLGGGFCIKKAAAQSYATDSEAIGIIQQLCDKHQIPWQVFMNRADEAGGSTLGAVGAGFLPVPTVDMGVPILAMHSARELMAEADMKALSDIVTVFFTEE